MQTTIELQRSAGRAAIVLTAPEGKPPTLDHEVLAHLERIVIELAANPPRLVVVRSASAKYFCVGANVGVLEAMTEDTIGPWVQLGHRVFNRLEDLPCPTIARVCGFAMGGGLELAMSCDLIFTSHDAKLGQSEAALGFIPGWGGTFRLVERVGVAQAKRLFYTGEAIGADAARELGLVDRVLPAGELDAALDAFANATSLNNATALSTFKRIVNAERRAARDRAAAAEARLSRDCCADPDARQRLQRFLARRK